MWIFPKIFVSHPPFAPFMNFIVFFNVSTGVVRTSVAYTDLYCFWYIYYVPYSAFYAYTWPIYIFCHSCSISVRTCQYFIIGCCDLDSLVVGFLERLLVNTFASSFLEVCMLYEGAYIYCVWWFSVHISYGLRVFLTCNFGCLLSFWYL
jgi:hypothetical protein